MKKLLRITAFISALTALSAFGQGYFQFTTGKSQAWDALDDGPATLSTRINTSFLWAANGAVPQVAGLGNSTPPNNLTPPVASAAWTAILTDPNFILAVNGGNGQLVVQRTAANGSIAYNGGLVFPIIGTSPATVYSLFMISWDGAYATPILAQAASAAVGWSGAFSYTATALTASPNSMVGLTAGFEARGVPEPSAFALAGLGGLSLWLFRRRK